jgi:hypothetical protein
MVTGRKLKSEAAGQLQGIHQVDLRRWGSSRVRGLVTKFSPQREVIVFTIDKSAAKLKLWTLILSRINLFSF